MIVAGFCGGWFGLAIGGAGAPAWEMAFVIVAPIAAITGGLAAALAAHSAWKGGLASVAAVALAAKGMAWLARQNPSWVVVRCTGAVVVAGVVGALIGLGARALMKTRPPGPTTPRQGPGA